MTTPPMSTNAIRPFSGKTANEVWSAALAEFAKEGSAQRQSSRAGDTRELLNAVFIIADPRQRWTLARQPGMNPAFAIAEALWVIWGRKDSALPVFFNSTYSKFNGPGPAYGGAYGHRLRKGFGVDQLTRAAEALSASADSRQVVLQIWDATQDLPDEGGRARRTDIPCNLMSMLKVRGNELHWTQILRSNDLILGVPYNFVQFTMLQEVLAGWIGVNIGSYTHFADSLHLYDRDLASSSVPHDEQPIANTDNLALPKRDSDLVLAALEVAVNVLIDPLSTRSEFERALEVADYPEAYGNLLAILGAGAARRRSWLDLSAASATRCTNAALRQMWMRWLAGRPRKTER